MKKLTILLTLLLSVGFSQIMIPDTSKMTNTEKMMWYQNEKKSPALGMLYSFLLPTAGHAYAGDWKRGILFKGSQLFVLLFSVHTYKKAWGKYDDDHYWENQFDGPSPTPGWPDYDPKLENVVRNLILVDIFVLFPWELIDVAKTAKKNNRQLYKSIFGKDPSVQFSLFPQPKGIGLGLSYNF